MVSTTQSTNPCGNRILYYVYTNCRSGFTQTGPFFKEKCRALERQLSHSLSGNIDFYYPTGPCSLWNFLDPQYVPSKIGNRNELHAWWKALDGVSVYDELDTSLDHLSAYIHHHGPFDGIVGFSQGAVMAMILTSLCEARTVPGRAEALLNQPTPIAHAAPQAPFKFAIIIAGFKASPPNYPGLFSPRVVTPSLHIIAELDTMVENRHSFDLAATGCTGAKVVTHVAGHVVPTSTAVLSQVADFVLEIVTPRRIVFPRKDAEMLKQIWLLEGALQSLSLQRPGFKRAQTETDAKWRVRPVVSVRPSISRSLSEDTMSVSSSSSSSAAQRCCTPFRRHRPRRRVVRVYR